MIGFVDTGEEDEEGNVVELNDCSVVKNTQRSDL